MSIKSLLKQHDILLNNTAQELSENLLDKILEVFTNDIAKYTNKEGHICVKQCVSILTRSINKGKVPINKANIPNIPNTPENIIHNQLPKRYCNKYDRKISQPNLKIDSNQLVVHSKIGKKLPKKQKYTHIIDSSSDSDGDSDSKCNNENSLLKKPPTILTETNMTEGLLGCINEDLPTSRLTKNSAVYHPMQISKETLLAINISPLDDIEILPSSKTLINHLYYMDKETKFIFSSNNWKSIGYIKNKTFKRF